MTIVYHICKGQMSHNEREKLEKNAKILLVAISFLAMCC